MDDTNNTNNPQTQPSYQPQQPLPPQPSQAVERPIQGQNEPIIPPQIPEESDEQYEEVAQPIYQQVYGQEMYAETNTLQNEGITKKFILEVLGLITGGIVIVGLLTGYIAIGVSGVVLFFIVGIIAIIASIVKMQSIKASTTGAKKEKTIWATIGIALLFVIAGASALMTIFLIIGFILIILFLSTGPQT